MTLQGLPPAVQQAVKEQSRGATLRGVAKEVKDGVTFYEAELTVQGRKGEKTFFEGHITHGPDLTEVKVDANGKPVE